MSGTKDKTPTKKKRIRKTKATKKELSLKKKPTLISSQAVFEYVVAQNSKFSPHVNAPKIRTGQQIYIWLCQVLGVPFINVNAPTSQYIKGPDPVLALRAFAAVLNNSPNFRNDGLALTPGELGGAKTMMHVGGAIVAWYQRNGWIVT